MITDSSTGNSEEERRADYYTEHWSYEAVSRYFYNKVQQKRVELEQALGIRNSWTAEFLSSLLICIFVFVDLVQANLQQQKTKSNCLFSFSSMSSYRWPLVLFITPMPIKHVSKWFIQRRDWCKHRKRRQHPSPSFENQSEQQQPLWKVLEINTNGFEPVWREQTATGHLHVLWSGLVSNWIVENHWRRRSPTDEWSSVNPERPYRNVSCVFVVFSFIRIPMANVFNVWVKPASVLCELEPLFSSIGSRQQ